MSLLGEGNGVDLHPSHHWIATSIYGEFTLANDDNSRKTRLSPQASSEHADAQSRPQVSREMLPVHWQARIYLSNAIFECTSFVKRLPPKTANLNSTSTTKTRTNKCTRRLRYPERLLLKLTYKASKNKYTTDEDKKNQIHSQIKIHLMNIT